MKGQDGIWNMEYEGLFLEYVKYFWNLKDISGI